MISKISLFFKKYYPKIFLLLFTVSTLTYTAYKTDDRLFEIAKNLDVFATMYKELNSLYVDELNPTKTMRIGIQAMLKELDPYTVFYPEDEIEEYFTMNVAAYNGIGANIEYFQGSHLVVSVFEESPADKAGIKPGDKIIKINGVDVKNRNDAEFGRLLKGQTGTNVKVQIERLGNTKPLDFSVNREVVKTPNVPHYGMIDDLTGYIQLTDFSPTAAKEIKSATLELKGKGMKNLVIDLRSNPGGLLQQAVEICNFFLQKGVLVVETKGKVKEWNLKYNTQNQPLDLEMPVAVLINGRSASASEIVSGTLQDYDRAVLIGERSYGKGLVQITRDLSFNTKMKVTTSKYYIPSGRCIQAIDYGHKNTDGSFQKLPDSLRAAFKTKNGRVVLDGAGIDPDIITKQNQKSVLLEELIKQKIIFDYATLYYFQYTTQKPKENFNISDAQMLEFEQWLQKSRFNYKTSEQKNIEDLLKSSEFSNDSDSKKRLEELKKVVDRKALELVKRDREIIREALELEILGRYHYQKAMKFVSFEKDEDIQEALNLFKNQVKYKSILSGK